MSDQSIRESGNRSPTEQSTRAYLAQTVISPEELVGELEDSRAVPQITVDPNLAEPSVRPTLDSGAVASGLEDTDFQVNWCDGATLIGRFRIRQLLGTGAFGAVYLADDPHLDRRVAIKVAKTGVLPQRDDIDRFLREARAAAQLRHPHIVPVYEVGSLGSSSFIVYEYIEGRTLSSLLRERGRLPAHEAAEMMRKIAAALGYAHAHHIVHRDMKPENVLLDTAGQPHIADFGLARRDDQTTSETREGFVVGTPAFMSPEQASGRGNRADARSDVWSLGVMLQQMLTGVLPFQGNLTQILVAVQNVEPAALRTIDARLPRDLETICQKCLRKDPAQRYQSATELADELERWLRGEPILARPLGVFARTGRWIRRNPTIAKLLGTIGATLLLGAGVSTYFAIEATQQAALVRQGRHDQAVIQLNSLKSVVPHSVPVLIEALRPVREEIESQLREHLAAPDLTPTEQNRLRLALVSLFPEDRDREAQLEQAVSRLLEARPDEASMIVQVLQPFRKELIPQLVQLADAETDRERRFRASCALASWLPAGALTESQASDLAAGLLACDPTDLTNWLSMVRPVRDRLSLELTQQMLAGEEAVRSQAARTLSLLFADQSEMLYEMLMQAEGDQLRPLLQALSQRPEPVQARLRADLAELLTDKPLTERELHRRRNRFIAALALAPDAVPWSVLGSAPDKELRTELIENIPRSGVSWTVLARRLPQLDDPFVRVALLEILAGYPVTELLPADRLRLRGELLALYRTDPDPGVHSAAHWLLNRWGFDATLELASQEETADLPPLHRRWYRDQFGQTFAVIGGPVEFLMGAAPDDPQQASVEQQHRRLIPRSFGLATHEVTVEEFLRFAPDHEYNTEASPEPRCPINDVTWIDAVKYCRWLSEQAGLPESEMCYPPLDQIGPEMALPDDLLDRTGYRLPTAAEWEFACRAGAATSLPFGHSTRATGHYAWYGRNAQHRTWPVGRLRPNDFGLFDLHGNVMEWCQDWYFDEYPEPPPDGPVVDGTDTRTDGVYREIRGGSFQDPQEVIRTPDRDYDLPGNQSFVIGFRLARTFRP